MQTSNTMLTFSPALPLNTEETIENIEIFKSYFNTIPATEFERFFIQHYKEQWAITHCGFKKNPKISIHWIFYNISVNNVVSYVIGNGREKNSARAFKAMCSDPFVMTNIKKMYEENSRANSKLLIFSRHFNEQLQKFLSIRDATNLVIALNDACYFNYALKIRVPENIIALKTFLKRFDPRFIKELELSNLKCEIDEEEFKIIFENCKNLENLILQNCKFKKLPDNINGLTHLRSLTLNECTGLFSLPDISGLTYLQTLEIENCDNLETIAKLGSLINLKKISFMRCNKIITLPDLSGLPRLQTLSFCVCRDLLILPDLSGLTNLQSLHFECCANLRTIPEIICLTNLQYIYIEFCDNLITIPAISGFTNLTNLTIGHCENLRTITEISGLTNLETITIIFCKNLNSLPDFIGITNLKTLHLHGCKSLIPLTITGLPNWIYVTWP